METPYTGAIQELNTLVEEGKKIAEGLAKAKKRKGQIDIAAEIAKHYGLAKPPTVDRFSGAVKQVAEASADSCAVEILPWYERLHDVVVSLRTGKRKCELSEREKRSILKDLEKAGHSKSPKTVLTRSLRIASYLVTRLTVLEHDWKPKGKLIPAGRLIKGVEQLENILADCQGYVKVCDPYCSRQTLSILEATPKQVPITILTMKVSDKSEFVEALNRMRQHGRAVRVAVYTSKPGFHDRFIVTQGRGWTVGTSIKDIGNKDTLIHEIENRKEVEKMIDEYLSGSRGPLEWL